MKPWPETRSICTRCWRLSGPRAVARPSRWPRGSSLGAGAVGRSVLVRLARLGPDCERLAEAVAVLAASSPLRHAASLAGLERAAAQSAADSLCQADLLLISRPYVRPPDRARGGRRRARAGKQGGASSRGREAARCRGRAGRPGGGALALAESFGEQWVVDALRRAARRAIAQGAPEAAVSYLRRALASRPRPRRGWICSSSWATPRCRSRP